MAESMQSRRRSRLVRIGSTVGVLVVAALVAWGFSRSDDDRPDSPPGSTPGIGVINAPADVNATHPDIVLGSAPETNDVPRIPVGTADIILPPASSDIVSP